MVRRNFAAVLYISILLLLSVWDCLMLQQQLFKRQGRKELCVCGVASSDWNVATDTNLAKSILSPAHVLLSAYTHDWLNTLILLSSLSWCFFLVWLFFVWNPSLKLRVLQCSAMYLMNSSCCLTLCPEEKVVTYFTPCLVRQNLALLLLPAPCLRFWLLHFSHPYVLPPTLLVGAGAAFAGLHWCLCWMLWYKEIWCMMIKWSQHHMWHTQFIMYDCSENLTQEVQSMCLSRIATAIEYWRLCKHYRITTIDGDGSSKSIYAMIAWWVKLVHEYGA